MRRVCAGVYDVRIAFCYIATGKAHQAYQKLVWGICAKRCAPAHISLWAFRSTCCCDWVCARYAPARFQAMAESWPYGPSACNMGCHQSGTPPAKATGCWARGCAGYALARFQAMAESGRTALALATREPTVGQTGLQSHLLL